MRLSAASAGAATIANALRSMRLTAVTLCWTTVVAAQHSDIAVYRDALGRVTTHASTGNQARVFQRNFDFWGDFNVYGGDDPGFQQGSNPPPGFFSIPDATLRLNLVPVHIPSQGLGSLLYWDGTTPDVEYGTVPANHVLYVEDASTLTEVALTGSTDRFEGLIAGVFEPDGSMHQHMGGFVVENNGMPPQEGIYLMGWELEVAGLEKSRLVIVALSAPTMSASARAQSAAWLTGNIDTIRVAGDFDDNGYYETEDVDALVATIAAGSHPPEFDLTLDGLVDGLDLARWRELAGSVLFNTETTVGLPTSGDPVLPGDANLDGAVDGTDFGIWNANKFSTGAVWSTADFNADGAVDGTDFGIWNIHKFTSVNDSRPQSVPEPVGALWLWVLLVLPAIRGGGQ